MAWACKLGLNLLTLSRSDESSFSTLRKVIGLTKKCEQRSTLGKTDNRITFLRTKQCFQSTISRLVIGGMQHETIPFVLNHPIQHDQRAD